MRPITTSLLVIFLLLSACSQPAALQPTPVPPTVTPPPTPSATPDPYIRFIQQLDSARPGGYLPASYTGDPGGAPLLLAGLDLALARESGLLPVSPDGLELGRIDGDQLVLPRLEAIPYRSLATGELSIYSFSNTDGVWNYYTNLGGPALEVPVSLPTGLADLVGVYSAPAKDPALVAAKLMPDGSIKITPIVFTEDEDVAFGAESVTIAGQEVFYNQLTSAWEAPLTPTPETNIPGLDADAYEANEFGWILAIKDGEILGASITTDDGEQTTLMLGERGAVMFLDENGNWQNLMIKIQGKTGSQEVNPKASGIFPTPHGLMFEGKNDQPSVQFDNDGNLIQLDITVVTLANGEKLVWDKDTKTWQDGFRIGESGSILIYRPTSGRYEQFTTADNQKIQADKIVPLGNGRYAFIFEGKLSGAAQSDWTVTKSFNDMAPIGFDVFAVNPSGNVEKVPNLNYFDWAFSMENMIIKNEKTFPAYPNLKFSLVINPASIGKVRVDVLDSSAPRRFMEEAIFLRLERDNKLPPGVTDRDSFREYLKNGGSVTIPQLRAWNIETGQVEDMLDVPIKEIVIYSYTEGFDPPPPVRTRFGLAHDEPKTFDFIIDKPNNRLIVLNQCVDFSYLKNSGQRLGGFLNMTMGDIISTALFLNTSNFETKNLSKSGRMIQVIDQNIMDKILAIIMPNGYYFIQLK